MVGADPFEILGLPDDASASEIAGARRNLAKSAHPDVGGSVAEMQVINAAADAARVLVETNRDGAGAPERPHTGPDRVSEDHPSFTVEALPVQAFEALLAVAATLGDVVDDEPPYVLETIMMPPLACWCRLSLVPDAGASTISIEIANEPGQPPIDIELVRDTWIAALNDLDWETLG